MPPAPARCCRCSSLGIPGSATAAVMMGGLMIWGLNPGPMLFVDQKDFVWGLIASMYVGNIVAVVLVLLTVPVFAALMRIPFVDHRAADRDHLRGRRLFGLQFLSRRRVDARLRRGRLSLQETVLSAGAAGARDRDRRQGRGRLPAIDADVEGLARDFLRQPAGDRALWWPASRCCCCRWCCRSCACCAGPRPIDHAAASAEEIRII